MTFGNWTQHLENCAKFEGAAVVDARVLSAGVTRDDARNAGEDVMRAAAERIVRTGGDARGDK